jgi:hypothetical protein
MKIICFEEVCEGSVGSSCAFKMGNGYLTKLRQLWRLFSIESDYSSIIYASQVRSVSMFILLKART